MSIFSIKSTPKLIAQRNGITFTKKGNTTTFDTEKNENPTPPKNDSIDDYPVRRALQRINNGISLLLLLESTLETLHMQLSEMLESSVLAASILSTDSERQALDQDYQAALSQINQTCNETLFAGQPLLNGQLEELCIVIEDLAPKSSRIVIDLTALASSSIHLGLEKEALPNFFTPYRLATREDALVAFKKTVKAMDMITEKHVLLARYALAFEDYLLRIECFESDLLSASLSPEKMQEQADILKRYLPTDSDTAINCQAGNMDNRFLSKLIVH